MSAILLILGGACLAYANGANDNFKGVATLFGSGTSDYRRALQWATMTTLAGSLASILVAQKLITIFSGKGLVSEQIVGSPAFLSTVALATAATILAATRLGFPVSTTHGLLGALLGPAVVAGALDVDWAYFGAKFVLPLLASPIIAVALSFTLYAILRSARERLGIDKEMCVCVGDREYVQPISRDTDVLSLRRSMALGASVETLDSCEERYKGRVLGVNVQKVLDVCHYISAGVVCFARGLNDTPKIAAIILAAGVLGAQMSGIWVGLGMALGGIIGARRIGEVMGKRITPMNHGQGFTANLVTGLLVILASLFALPVSTTHVSCATIFGIGAQTRQVDRSVVATIVLAWVVTLPVAMVFGALLFPWMSEMLGAT